MLPDIPQSSEHCLLQCRKKQVAPAVNCGATCFAAYLWPTAAEVLAVVAAKPASLDRLVAAAIVELAIARFCYALLASSWPASKLQ